MSNADNPPKDGPRAPAKAEKSVTVTPARAARAAPPLPTPPHSDEPMELKSNTELELKASTKIESKPEPKPETKPEPKTETGTEPEKAAKTPAEEKTAKKRKPKKEAAKKEKPEKEKKPRKGRGAVSWFVAGIGLAVVIIGGVGSWNVWSEPHYVLNPQLDALMQDYGGYLAAAALFGLALTAGMVLRRRWALVVPMVLVILGVLVAVGTTVLLGVGVGALCGRQPVFQVASPDRRLLVSAVRGKCGVTRELTYRISVRELGPTFPRQTVIFQSFGKPVPTEVIFSKDRTITVLVKGATEGAATRHTVTIDRKTMMPDKVWRFDVRTE